MEELNLTLLRRARYRRHLTVEQAANVIGKKRTAIWRYETGVSDISVRTLCKLLDAYGASVVDVFVKKPKEG